MSNTKMRSFRLEEASDKMLDKLSEQYNVSRTELVHIAISELYFNVALYSSCKDDDKLTETIKEAFVFASGIKDKYQKYYDMNGKLYRE